MKRFPPVIECHGWRQNPDRRGGWWVDLEYGQIVLGVWLFWWSGWVTLRWRQCEFCDDPICSGEPCVYADVTGEL